jgi:hypothetical protein
MPAFRRWPLALLRCLQATVKAPAGWPRASKRRHPTCDVGCQNVRDSATNLQRSTMTACRIDRCCSVLLCFRCVVAQLIDCALGVSFCVTSSFAVPEGLCMEPSTQVSLQTAACTARCWAVPCTEKPPPLQHCDIRSLAVSYVHAQFLGPGCGPSDSSWVQAMFDGSL